MTKNINKLTSKFYTFPIFFNFFINDLFIFIEITIFCNYTDDNTMYSFSQKRQYCDRQIFRSYWNGFINFVVLNADKCHLLTLGFNEPFPDFSFDNTTTENVTEQKVLAIVNDNELNFKFQSNLRKCLFLVRGPAKHFLKLSRLVF